MIRSYARVLLIIVFALAARPASAAPGAATLLNPSGEVSGSTIAFSWDSVPTATWYLFWVGTSSALVQQQWFTAQQAGCAGGGTCTIVVTPPLPAGPCLWYIQTWGDGASGPWSDAKVFTLRDPLPPWGRKLPDNRRLTLVLDNQAVLDNETGLIWQRTPGGPTTWQGAITACVLVTNGTRSGWRVPTVSELTSLAVVGQSPTLAAGHPFDLGSSTLDFWSDTLYADTGNMIVANFAGPGVFIFQSAKTAATLRSWCVRGPTGGNR